MGLVRIAESTILLRLTNFILQLEAFSLLPYHCHQSHPSFVTAAAGLGACCRDYCPAMSDQFHLSFMGLFIFIVSPSWIVPSFRCNRGWAWYVLPSLLFCYVRPISSFSWRHFHCYHTAVIRSSPSFVAAAAGLGACCRDYCPAVSDQSHLSFAGLFISIMSPSSIAPSICCNHGWAWYVLPSLLCCYV